MAKIWIAEEIVQLQCANVQEKYDKLQSANIVVCFVEQKAFKNGRMNWGKVSKTNALIRALTSNVKEYDFVLHIPSETWQLLTDEKRKALLDLHVSRCTPSYVPKTEMVNGKKVKILDDYDRVTYSDEIKLDRDGNIVWKILSLDLPALANNVEKHGPWCNELECIQVKPKIIPQHDVAVSFNE